MKLSEKELAEIREFLGNLPRTKEAELMKRCIQHGRISTYEHVIRVVRRSFYFNRRFHLGASDAELVRGAFLHDFYLYDWHKNSYVGRLHGYHHPAIALKNAMERYELTETEQNIIASHMWPLTLFRIPRCREAVIVCFADKLCSIYEVFAQRRKAG